VTRCWLKPSRGRAKRSGASLRIRPSLPRSNLTEGEAR
jgi:hypothetical protein